MNKRQAKEVVKRIEAEKKAMEAARSSMARDMAISAARTRRIEAEMKARWADVQEAYEQIASVNNIAVGTAMLFTDPGEVGYDLASKMGWLVGQQVRLNRTLESSKMEPPIQGEVVGFCVDRAWNRLLVQVKEHNGKMWLQPLEFAERSG